jgi:hypothetical protein
LIIAMKLIFKESGNDHESMIVIAEPGILLYGRGDEL